MKPLPLRDDRPCGRGITIAFSRFHPFLEMAINMESLKERFPAEVGAPVAREKAPSQ
ncbi:MAG: hypothetical protein NTV33_11845 [Coprothermobacterota bacterium]|nr:hypothetical protein [Coprothermobacterota bacterium]